MASGPVVPGVPGGPGGPSGPGGAVGLCFNGFLVGPPRPAPKSSTRLYVFMTFQLGDLMDSVDLVRKQFCWALAENPRGQFVFAIGFVAWPGLVVKHAESSYFNTGS